MAKIDKTHAKQLHKLFAQQNKNHMMTHEGKPLKGFYIEREHLEEILSDKGFTGIHFYLGKHPDHQNTDDNVFTLVYTGARPNPNYKPGGGKIRYGGPGDPVNGGDDTGNGGSTPYTNDGDCYDMANPCPDHCGTLGN